MLNNLKTSINKIRADIHQTIHLGIVVKDQVIKLENNLTKLQKHLVKANQVTDAIQRAVQRYQFKNASHLEKITKIIDRK